MVICLTWMRFLASGKGICFDLCRLLAALLRLQGIPAKLKSDMQAMCFMPGSAFIRKMTDGFMASGFMETPGICWTPPLAACGGGSPLIGGGNEYK